MNQTSVPTRFALGQVFLLLGVLTFAKMLGFIPDQDERIIAGRVAVCEAVAMNTAELVSQDKTKQLDTTLERVVERSPGMRSAGVRKRGGTLIARAANHQARWKPLASDRSSDRSSDVQIQIPIWIGQQRWGRIEFCYEPLAYSGKYAWLLNPWILHTVFVLAASYVAFTLYLGRRCHSFASPAPPSRSPAAAASSPDRQAPDGQFDLRQALGRSAPGREDGYVQAMNGSERSSLPTSLPSNGSGDAQPITSSLATRDPVFREIVHGFVESLGVKILEVHAAWERRDLQEVARLAHWIKGSGGTVGFDDFTHPSIRLQEAAQQDNLAEVEAVIAEIISLYQRINTSSANVLREDALA